MCADTLVINSISVTPMVHGLVPVVLSKHTRVFVLSKNASNVMNVGTCSKQ